jgi:DNA-directed RNA polymerase specialized sigma24 family protein
MTTSRPNPVFVTTKWTRVLAARGDSTDARVALGELCEVYYEPVVAYLRARWRDEDRARELAHAFFERLLAHPSLAGAHPERGRFRSYLLGALKHFLADLRDYEQAAKRGAGAEHLPLEAGTDTSLGIDPPAPEGRPPEAEFDRQWALTILNRSLNALAAEHEAADRRAEFSALKPWLVPGTVGVSQAEVAGRLGVNESAVKVAIHRLRKRFRELVKAEIARTVDEPSQVNVEMSYLVTVLAA